MAQYYSVKTNCKFCGQLFDSVRLSKVCPTCSANMENYFAQIRDYIEKFPEAAAAEVCDRLNIPLSIINHFISEERLIAKNTGKDIKFVRRCGRCNKLIGRGHFCKECAILNCVSEMKGNQISAGVEKEESMPPKFHTYMNPNDIKHIDVKK